MRRLWFLLLLFIIFFCATYPRPYIENFENSDGFIHYLLKTEPVQLIELNTKQNGTVLFNGTGEKLDRKLEPTDPNLYGELLIENDKMDLNGETVTVDYYKRRKDFITIKFDNSEDTPITFSQTDKQDVISVKDKNSEIGTIQPKSNNSYKIKMISHPDATKHIPFIVGALLVYREKRQ